MRICLFSVLLIGSLLLVGAPADQISVATAALYAGELPRAAELAHDYVEKHPSDARGRLLLGQVLMAYTRYERAFSEFHEALRLKPDSADALYFLGKTALLLGQIQLRQLDKMAPDSARVHQLRGEFYQSQNRRAEAEQEFRAALQSDPKLIDVLNDLAFLRLSQFKYEEACSFYERAVAIDPSRFDSVYGLGGCQLRLKKPKEALKHLRRALALDPDSAAARFGVAKALMLDGRWEEAAAELEKVVAMEPDMGLGYLQLGNVYRKLGREAEAGKRSAAPANCIKQRRRACHESTVVGRAGVDPDCLCLGRPGNRAHCASLGGVGEARCGSSPGSRLPGIPGAVIRQNRQP